MAARFELGRAHEALGSMDRAREAWQAVAAVDEPGGLESFDDLVAEANEEGDEADDPAPAAALPEAEPTAEIPVANPDSGAPKKRGAKKKSKKKISFM
jgi:hypothetical protein